MLRLLPRLPLELGGPNAFLRSSQRFKPIFTTSDLGREIGLLAGGFIRAVNFLRKLNKPDKLLVTAH